MTAPGPPRRPRRRATIIRYVIGVALGAVVLALLLSRRGELSGASQRLGHLDPWWAAAALVLEAGSLAAYAAVQRVVLRASGVAVRLSTLFAVTVANDAIALSVPGEPAFSGVFRYRQYRRHGASGAGAGWSILTLLVAQAVGLSLLLLAGVLVALTDHTSHVGAGVTLIALAIVLLAGAVLVRRSLLTRLLDALVGASRRVTGHPRGDVGARVDRALANMRLIRVPRATIALVVALASAAWLLDAACLAAGFAAVRAHVAWHGLLLAYGVAQIVAVVPIVPGGFGLVEGSLTVILVAYGARRVPALAAVLVYRLVSFWLAIAVGWLTFAALVWRDRRDDRRGATTPGDVHVDLLEGPTGA